MDKIVPGYRLIIENAFDRDVDFDKPVEVMIVVPKMCPFCGSTSVSEQIKVQSSAGQQDSHKFIKVWVCKEHEKYGLPKLWKLCLIPCTFLLTAPFVLWIHASLAIICVIIGFGYFIYVFWGSTWFTEKAKKIIRFEYLEKTVIHVARKDWADEFSSLNPAASRTDGVKPFDESRLPVNKVVVKFLFTFLVTMVLFILSMFSRVTPLIYISAAAFFGGFILFLIVGLHSALIKGPRARNEAYFSKPNPERPIPAGPAAAAVETIAAPTIAAASMKAAAPAALGSLTQCFICHAAITLEHFYTHYKRCTACYQLFKKQRAKKHFIDGGLATGIAVFMLSTGIVQRFMTNPTLIVVLSYVILGSGVLNIGVGFYWLLGNPSTLWWGIRPEDRVKF